MHTLLPSWFEGYSIRLPMIVAMMLRLTLALLFGLCLAFPAAASDPDEQGEEEQAEEVTSQPPSFDLDDYLSNTRISIPRLEDYVFNSDPGWGQGSLWLRTPAHNYLSTRGENPYNSIVK